jgi:DNA (cytosine-5)-methyltransferase 1
LAFSSAGSRKGDNDNRYLWPEMLRVIREVQPTYIVGENVRGLTNWNEGMVFNQVQDDLETSGYEIAPVLLSSCSVETSHDRARIWFIANFRGGSDNIKRAVCEDREQIYKGGKNGVCFRGQHHRNYEFIKESKTYEAIEPIFCRENDGVSGKLDTDRIYHIGNAIVPQVAFEIFKAIESVYESKIPT